MKNEIGNESKFVEIDKQVEYLKYCHTKIDELKNSIYLRASILVIVIGFILPSWVSTIRGIIDNIPHDKFMWKLVLLILCGLFLLAFLITTVYGLKCLIPLKSKLFLLKILNISRNKKNNVSLHELSKLDPTTAIQDILDKHNVVNDDKARVFTTFGHICDLSEDNFGRIAKELDSEGISKQLLSATYNLSHITSRRYKDLFIAYKWLLVCAVIFVLLIMLEIVMNIIGR